MEEPLRYETLTGLSRGQLAELTARVAAVLGDVVRPGGAPAAIGLLSGRRAARPQTARCGGHSSTPRT
jgi:hypothetical protein